MESERTAKTVEILEYLTSVMRGEGTEVTVVTVGTGKGFSKSEKVIVPLSTKDRLKAAEHLAKIHGMFVEKIGGKLDANVTIIDDIKGG